MSHDKNITEKLVKLVHETRNVLMQKNNIASNLLFILKN